MTKIFDAPAWMTEAGITTLREGYLLKGESIQGMFRRVASTAATRLAMPEIEEQLMWALNEGYLCLASPILANFGTDRGLPISCYGQSIGDSIYDIKMGELEFAMLSKNGGGVSQYWGFVRPEGAPIKGGQNGQSNGTVPFAAGYDATVVAVSQGNVRRGANCFYWPANHGDRNKALRIRKPSGGLPAEFQSIFSNHAFIYSDEFMRGVVTGENKEDRSFWAEMIRMRVETGEPFLMFSDNANKLPSERLRRIYARHALKNLYSNICTEILLPGDLDHTFVCCISSMPIHKFKDWRGKGVVRLLVLLLDAVLDEFIEKASTMPGFERAVRFAQKSRAIGIGALGYHSFLQEEGLAFNSPEAREWNKTIFREIRDEAEAASQELAATRGEPEWCKGEGMRHTHLMAVAPTATNSVIAGQKSPGIEPWPANIFPHKTAKGTFILRNPTLERVLIEYGRNSDEVWRDINNHAGSVQHLDFLPDEVKKVFLTAYEMDMRDIVDQAADRQPYIDQGQSMNFFFAMPKQGEKETQTEYGERLKPWYKYVNACHIYAWEKGIKTIYYCRSNANIKADTASRGHERREIPTRAPAPATQPPAIQQPAAPIPAAPAAGPATDDQDEGGCKACEG